MWMLNNGTKLHFLYKFFQAPQQIGSVTPSSSFLVHKMLNQVDWRKVKTIAELGAGTGVFTKEIIRRKRKDCRFLAYESDPELSQRLSIEYPALTICNDAHDLKGSSSHHGVSTLDCIVSGLPFSNFTKNSREVIFQQIADMLSEDGVFVAFQYSLLLKELFKHYFASVKIIYTPFNLPPAFIFICKKRRGPQWI